jgi:type IV pilus assembly protein PilO
MKLSSKERNTLIVVVSILIAILYYQFGYLNLSAKLEEKNQKKIELETKYNKVQSDIATLDERKGKVKELSTKSIDMASGFYPQIIQPKIILELNEIMEKSGVIGDLQFEEVQVKEVEDITPNTPELPKTSFEGITSVINNSMNNVAANNINSGSAGANVTVAGITCEQFKVVINIPKINVDNWEKLMKNLEAYDRRIVMNTLKLTGLSEKEASITLALEFYGVPKINNIDSKYLDWDVNKVNSSSGLTFTDGVLRNTGDVQNDFVALLKPSTSEITTFRMGRANDETCASYIYDDQNGISQVVLQLTEKDGKYYYKYSVGNKSMSTSTTADGSIFVPKGDEITLKVLSELRASVEDIAGMKLKVINNTKKTVNVVVDGDDKTKPRVDVTSEGGTVNVK